MRKSSSPSPPTRLSARQLVTALVPNLEGLKFDQISIESCSDGGSESGIGKNGGSISLSLRMISTKSECPACHRHSTRVHSRYTRTLVDLPWSSFIVTLYLHVRKFFCVYPDCRRRIFTERLPDLVAPYARRTTRQRDILRLIGLALGGRAGSRLLSRLQMHVSHTTLLEVVRNVPEHAYPTPRVLGVDDFALRKGISYGTILVDLERHQPVDVLPSRKADVLAKWLREHPGSQIITRDRSAEYARAIAEGAPKAIQVADRFHLLSNVRDALERVLDCNRSKLGGISLPRESNPLSGSSGTDHTDGGRASTQQLSQVRQVHQVHQVHQPEELTSTEAARQHESRQRRRHLYQQVQELYSQGVQIKAIAKQLKLSRMTIFRYVRLGADPVPVHRRPRPSMIDPYVPFLYQRWQDGCRNGGQLWRELQELGYPGSRKMLTVWVGQQRKKEGTPSSSPSLPSQSTAPTSRRLAWFLVRDPQSLTMAEQAVIVQLQQTCQEAMIAYRLVHDFQRIMKCRLAEELNGWLKAAVDSGISAMQNFSLGIEKDKAAVVAAVSYEWSQGQVEGQVNRLKLRKRQLYGRANFDLLRQYVLNQT
jgi:transposase